MPILGIIASSTRQGLLPVYTNDYESIATQTLVATSSSISFTSIPSTYKALQIRAINAGDTNTNVRLRLNNDTGSNYTFQGLQGGPGYGTAAYGTGSAGTNQTSMLIFDQQLNNNTYYNPVILDIVDYTSTNKYKTVRCFSGVNDNTNGFVYLFGGVWYSTAAISTITIFPFSGNFYAGTTYALYGTK